MPTQTDQTNAGATARHPLQCRRRHCRELGGPRCVLLRAASRCEGCSQAHSRKRSRSFQSSRGEWPWTAGGCESDVWGRVCPSRLCRRIARCVRRSVRRRRTAGLWLVDPVNGATARWGLGPVCKVRVTHLADDATAIGFSWHHAIGDMQTLMHLMNAWTAAAAGKPIAEPLIVENRAAYLDEHLPADGACRARGAFPRARRVCT